MKKIITYLIVFTVFYATGLFCKENKLAKISNKSYYEYNALKKIIHRYEKHYSKRYVYKKSKKFLFPVVKASVYRKKIFKGIFIKPKYQNSAVLSAQKGRVLFSGFLKYFGNVVIVKHYNGYTTTYAFLKAVNVAKGDYVYQGDKLGYSYKKHAIYFEIRKRTKCLVSSKYKKFIDNG